MTKSYQCNIREITDIPTLSIRTRTAVQDLPSVIHESYGAIIRYLGQIGEQPRDYAYAAYYNMDMQNLDVEIGFSVSKELPGKNNVKASKSQQVNMRAVSIPVPTAKLNLHTTPSHSG